MNTDLETLARRAVACPRWRWMDGMLLRYPPVRGAVGQQAYPTHARVTDLPEPLGRGYGVIDLSNIGPGALPDLSDPATLGCLLALVRDAWGKPDMHARREGPYWRVWTSEPGGYVHPSEAAALVAALEAAP